VLIDGAQAVSHTQIDVQDLGCDFYAFSGHKMFGPTGIGVLYAKSSRLAQMKPYQGGGDMITSVSFERSVYADPPALFEAGTPHIAGAIGLGAAADYVRSFDMREIEAYEQDLLNYATEVLSQIPNLRIIGTAEHKSAIISFTLKDIHPHDIGTILDNEGVAIRTGHHCAQPIMDFFAIPATARASFAFYNTKDEVDRLDQAIRKTIKLFDF
jgi:cysteine desulfurase/selenocysteine lyase